jgi:hypothetical protein
MAHEDGIDLYERGGNIAMANLWHLAMPTVLGADRFDELRRLFIVMVRGGGWESVVRFHGFVDRLFREFAGTEWEEMFGLLLASIERVAFRDYAEWDDSDLDPAIPSFVDLGCFWTGELQAPFDIIHDASKSIGNERERLSLLMSVSEPTQLVGYDRRKGYFPIKATGISLVESSAHPEVQLADVVSGAAAHLLKKRALGMMDGFAQEIAASAVIDAHHHIVWPTHAVTPKELGTEERGGVNIVDHVVAYLQERRTREGE